MPTQQLAKAPLLDPDRALEMVLEHTPTKRSVTLPLEQAIGLQLSETLRARCPQPPFSRGLMDGFAVRAGDGGKIVEVRGEAAAGRKPDTSVTSGTAVAIMTGAACPPGTEAIAKIEDTVRHENRVELPASLPTGQHIQAEGSLCRKGDTLVGVGAVLTPLGLASAIACGCTHARVAATPRLTVITTGDELRFSGQPLDEATIYDSNGPMLSTMARQLGRMTIERLHASDDPASLQDVLERSSEADIVVLSGGVSMGRYDLVPGIVEAAGGKTVFHKVRQKPGKPLLFAERNGQLVFGLPGTPLGSHLCFHRYVAACIRKWMGRPATPEERTGWLSGAIKSQGTRTLFRPVRATACGSGWRIDPMRWRGSSDLVGPAWANAYCRIVPDESPLSTRSMIRWEPMEGMS